MSNEMNKERNDLKHFFVIFIICLTILMGCSLAWSIYQEYQSADEYAKVEASASFNKDLLYRRWATMHGGVYVPITETTPPNPYLEFLSDRDITTSTGKNLTLVDHAYMTRQVHIIAESQYGVKGHLTSLNPIRPENKADAWETKALKLFEKGVPEFSSIEEMGGKEYLRYMHLMKIESNCLKCHSRQGYKLGNIRGGISVSIPMDKYYQIALSHSKIIIISYFFIYVILIILSILAYNRFLKEMIKRNLTQRKVLEHEAALTLSEIRYRRLFESAKDGILILEAETGMIIDVNPFLIEILGYSEDQFIKKAIWEIGFFKDIVANHDKFLELQQKKYVRYEDLPLETADGRKINVEFISNVYLVDKNKVIQCNIRDITQRKRAEETLHDSREDLYRLLNSMYEGAYGVDINGNCTFVNRAFLQILGYQNDHEVLGKHLHELIHHSHYDGSLYPSDECRMYRAHLINQPINVSDEVFWRKDGVAIPVEYWSHPIEKDGVVIGSIATFIDINERKRAEKELIEAKERAEESDNLKTSFLNNISHEIRTPFNGLLGFLSLIQDEDLPTNERDEYISIINKSAYRLMNTINDIVEISQIQAGQMKLTSSKTDIRRLTSELYSHFKSDAESKGLKFFLTDNLPNNIDCIYTDSLKLNAILSNLISNAIKFTKTGSIQFGIRLANQVDEHAVETRHALSLQFSVKDTGIGISEDKRQAIFERFMQADGSNTRHFEGSGLGLSIAKAYVEMLGGKIWVESDPEGKSGEKGSTFYFTIPYSDKPKEKTAIKNVVSNDKTDNQINHEVSGLKILIVEDDIESAILLAIAVKLYSKEVIKVRTGNEAVEACRNNPDIDLVFMDIKIPVMDGYEVTRQIRQFNTKVVIIAQTAFALIGDREKAIEAGCNDYISKPIKKDQLMVLMQKYF